MSARPAESVDTHRLLVIANETLAGDDLIGRIREAATARPTDVLIVAPALTERLHYWVSDEDGGIAAAGARLGQSIQRCDAAGISARGAIGDADPLQALDDAVRTFAPDEVIIATHATEGANWLERGLVAQAKERYAMPITHFVVDSVTEPAAHIVDQEVPDRRAPARERHTGRDMAILGFAWVIAILGSLISGLLYWADAPAAVLAIWVVVFDLGLKIAAALLVWFVFQRRARADRLDF